MKLVIRDAEERDLEAIKRLTDEYIAADYYSLEDLRVCLPGNPEDRNLFYVVTDADAGDRVVSYFYAFLAELDRALPLMHVQKRPEALKDLSGDTLVGVYKLSSTEAAYQHHGLCSSFVRNLEPVLLARGAKMIVATALRPLGQDAPMRHIFESHGFRDIALIPRPWVEMTLYCPYCKRNHCICDAVFFAKNLGEC